MVLESAALCGPRIYDSKPAENRGLLYCKVTPSLHAVEVKRRDSDPDAESRRQAGMQSALRYQLTSAILRRMSDLD